ncbi:MAG: hypothetical protein AAF564_17810 [Bacteroidota bacterium]
MKKSWTDFEDVSYRAPAKTRAVKLPAGVRAPAVQVAPELPRMAAQPTQVLIIDGLAPSLNKDKRSSKGQRRSKALEQAWYLRVKLAARDQGILPPSSYPITVRCECYFGPGQRRLDWVNLATTAKLTEDGLVRCGILRNDSPVYVLEGSMRPMRTDGESYTKFIITEVSQ